jgi:hypothetical protein
MAGFAFGGRAKHGSNIVIAFDIRLLGEIEITAVRLRFAGESLLQIGFGFAALQFSHLQTPFDDSAQSAKCRRTFANPPRPTHLPRRIRSPEAGNG